ncbi:hypothetical protein ACQ4M3_31875 [Leptolyngbya sp. AN03gr2]|uniref:hypothetical protein n=1 Tax=unclassified Leptolyngbya TaxID=2650499 RepID=UPI003D31B816
MLKFVSNFSGLMIGSTVAFLGISSLIPAIATAPTPPQLDRAVLGGKPIHVLSMTRSGDRVLIRCYPGQQPKLTVQTRTDGVKEGLLVCGN